MYSLTVSLAVCSLPKLSPSSAGVVSGELLLKLGESRMHPEIEPSEFWFNLDLEMVGRPRGKVAALAILSVEVFALALGAASAVTGVSVVPFGEPPIPNRGNAGRRSFFADTGCFFPTGAFSPLSVSLALLPHSCDASSA